MRASEGDLRSVARDARSCGGKDVVGGMGSSRRRSLRNYGYDFVPGQCPKLTRAYAAARSVPNFVPDGEEAWHCCATAKVKHGDLIRLESDVSDLMRVLELEHEVYMNASKPKFPRRPNTSTTVDLLEMFAGTMPFTRAAAECGLWSLEPQDLWTGWDYHRQWDVQRTL